MGITKGALEMQKVQSLQLPQRLPHENAVRSFGDNLHSYEPEFWEFQYQCYRYLERVPETVLVERYKDILRNMKALVSRDRDVIPIQSFLSSWYWFRKEHQTRLEFSLRHAALPVTPPVEITFDNVAVGAPARPAHPNAGDILFRYDRRKYIELLANEGLIRIRPASGFKSLENDRARQDDECEKMAFLPGAHTSIMTSDGVNMPIVGDVKKTVSMADYYAFCMACDWDSDLFADFDGADSCIVIRGVDEFARRIQHAAAEQLPNWDFHHKPVEYFDPYERLRNEHLDPGMSKNFRFAYQREYRFLWFPKGAEVADGFKDLTLGNLCDLADVHYQALGDGQPFVAGDLAHKAAPVPCTRTLGIRGGLA